MPSVPTALHGAGRADGEGSPSKTHPLRHAHLDTILMLPALKQGGMPEAEIAHTIIELESKPALRKLFSPVDGAPKTSQHGVPGRRVQETVLTDSKGRILEVRWSVGLDGLGKYVQTLSRDDKDAYSNQLEYLPEVDPKPGPGLAVADEMLAVVRAKVHHPILDLAEIPTTAEEAMAVLHEVLRFECDMPAAATCQCNDGFRETGAQYVDIVDMRRNDGHVKLTTQYLHWSYHARSRVAKKVAQVISLEWTHDSAGDRPVYGNTIWTTVTMEQPFAEFNP
jgi:hypothetical protein